MPLALSFQHNNPLRSTILDHSGSNKPNPVYEVATAHAGHKSKTTITSIFPPHVIGEIEWNKSLDSGTIAVGGRQMSIHELLVHGGLLSPTVRKFQLPEGTWYKWQRAGADGLVLVDGDNNIVGRSLHTRDARPAGMTLEIQDSNTRDFVEWVLLTFVIVEHLRRKTLSYKFKPNLGETSWEGAINFFVIDSYTRVFQ
ncbi:uncharacterized protein FIBRA_02833 [Fibroporia radiculosa]|uniref:DUF6593 domain-containing protein n=1 Tax=Fibroporia radiculosa TaxID=599839 RepID=J4I999_9APHY|nr:uncharacterized protein FIBRA_02833 [Fibroporia radiculosa]CCM00791.1 predicted protein [Fibroporia radiculosa]